MSVEQARIELATKGLSLVHWETAQTWAHRALACLVLFQENRQAHWLMDAQDCMHEAYEHAALSSEGPTAVGYIETILIPLKQALANIK